MTRARNQGWDGLAAVFGYEPVSGTGDARLWGKLARELNTIGVTVEDVLEAAHRYREQMPNVECTPTALVKHYQRLMSGRTFGPRKPVCRVHFAGVGAANRLFERQVAVSQPDCSVRVAKCPSTKIHQQCAH